MRSRVCLLLAVALAAACGGGSSSAEDVVRAWSSALNTGDNEAAADLFARGATVVQGPIVVRLATHDEAVRWNAGLPCSGRIVAVERRGESVTATFALGDRTTSACDARPGTRVRALFRVHAGKIVFWHQLSGIAEPDAPTV